MSIDSLIESLIRHALDGCRLSRLLIVVVISIGMATFVTSFVKLSICLARGFRLYIWHQLMPTDFIKKYGKWAVVTGATDGIGLSTAKELARRGHSIILIGRNLSKLDNSLSSISDSLKVGAKAMAVKIDLATATPMDYDRIRYEIGADYRDIGVLVNNAGFVHQKYRTFHKFTAEESSSMVGVNVLSYVNFARIMLPGMLKRKRGLIINISSFAGTLPMPFMCLYGPTKSFVDAFGLQMQMEYSKLPIDIITVTAGPVHTKLVQSLTDVPAASSLVLTSSASYAKSFLSAASARLRQLTGCLSHEFQFWLGRKLLLSTWVYMSLYNMNIRMHIKDHDLSSKKPDVQS